MHTIPEQRHPTPRELEVLALVCDGRSTKQVADLLGISFKTAACHRMRLMEKAGVHDPISLFRWAHQNGYVEAPVCVGRGRGSWSGGCRI
jgi:DNA-binding NarL/FixJ family response regulator